METNLGVLNHRGQTFTLISLVEQGLNLKNDDISIFNARVGYPAILGYSNEELKKEIHLLIFKLCAITGADLAPTELFAEVLADEFKIFLLQFGYSGLSIEEILLAFRLNSKGTKYPSGMEPERISFKGSIFNIDSAAKVLANYMTLRYIFERKCENYIDGYEQ